MRHLHDKVAKIEDRTAPPKEEVAPTSDASAAYGMGMMMGDTLMITNGGGGVPGYGMYGVPGGIPDPYAQQQQGYGAQQMYGQQTGYGAPVYNQGQGMGGYY